MDNGRAPSGFDPSPFDAFGGFDLRPNKVSSMGRAIAASMWGEAQAKTFFEIRTRNVHYGMALNAARDALLALRRPTVEMFVAAGRASGMEETALIIWRAMIDAALASEGADDRDAIAMEARQGGDVKQAPSASADDSAGRKASPTPSRCDEINERDPEIEERN